MKKTISTLLLGLILCIFTLYLPANAQIQDYEEYLNAYVSFLQETSNPNDIYTDSIQVAVGDAELYIDGEEFQIPRPLETPSNEAVVPIRPIAEAMGKEVSYTSENNTVEIFDNDTNIATFSIDPNQTSLYGDLDNGTNISPHLIDGTTYLTLEDVSEILGCSVEYDSREKTISIERPFQSKAIIVTDNNLDKPFPDNSAVFESIHGYSILSFQTEKETKAAYQKLIEDGFAAEPVIMLSSTAQTAAITTGASALSQAIGKNYAPVKVAVIDTGVEKTHSFLKDYIVDAYSLTDSTGADNMNHGTHVAGIVHTFAPHASIIPIKVFNDSTETARSDVIAEAIYYAVEKEADVINMSLGGEGYSNTLEQAIEYAYNAGTAMVAAAGNESLNLDNTFYMPASIAECITVSAVGSNKTLASFSNYGSCVDIAAYGVDIYSSAVGNSYATFSGTSMAAPEVAGAIALVMSMGYPAREAENMVFANTVAPSVSNVKFYGRGILGNLNNLLSEISKCGDNAKWDLDDNGVLTISGTGDMYDYTYDTLPWYSKAEAIKSVIFEDGITHIGDRALLRCSNLESAIIPETVTSIGTAAFMNCSSLVTADLHDGITSIGEEAFYGCNSLAKITIPKGVTRLEKSVFVACNSVTDVTIPNNITYIGERAFYSCRGLTSITIPHSVTFIGTYAFSSCIMLTEATIPSSVTTLESHTFSSCSKLESVILQSGVTVVSGFMFWRCPSLKSVTIPDTVTSIYDYAFNECTSLETITIPDSVTSIGRKTFSGCTNLLQITIPENVTFIDDSAFNNCSKITSITIPNCITKIGDYTFAGCSSLVEITIPGDVKTIEKKAFYGCDSLTDIYYYGKEENWESIEISTDNDALNNAVIHYLGIPVTSISLNANSLQMNNGDTFQLIAEIAPHNATIKAVKWKSSNTSSASVTADGLVTARYAGKTTITATTDDGGYIASCDITVTELGTCGENVIWTIDVNGNLTISGSGSIKSRAFTGNSRIKAVVIEDGITSVGNNAFYNCTNLTSITICAKSTDITIGDNAFQNCTALETITIYEGLTYIGTFAFSLCSNLAHVNFTGTREAWSSIDISTGNAYLTGAALHCPGDIAVSAIALNKSAVTIGTGTTYQLIASIAPDNATNKSVKWTSSNSKVTVAQDGTITGGKSTGTAVITATALDSGVTANCNVTVVLGGTCGENVTWMLDNGVLTLRGDGAMHDYEFKKYAPWHSYISSIQSIAIEKGITNVGNYAFYECKNVTAVSIPNSVTSIGSSAFSDCLVLTNLTLPNSVSYIGSSAFSRCKKLKSLKIPEGITCVEDYTFNYCNSLTSVTLPSSLETIKGNVFNYCSALTSISLPDGLTSIGESAFSGCSVLANITIPDSVTYIGSTAFSSCYYFTSITLPSSITAINSYVFNNCTGLKSITIPSSVATIANGAFSSSKNLKNVYYLGTKEEWSNVAITSANNDPLTKATVHYLPPSPAVKQFTVAKDGNTVTVEISAKHLPEARTAFVAAYEDGRFLQIVPVTFVNGSASAVITVTSENRFKLVVFDSLQSLVPICESFEGNT